MKITDYPPEFPKSESDCARALRVSAANAITTLESLDRKLEKQIKTNDWQAEKIKEQHAGIDTLSSALRESIGETAKLKAAVEDRNDTGTELFHQVRDLKKELAEVRACREASNQRIADLTRMNDNQRVTIEQLRDNRVTATEVNQRNLEQRLQVESLQSCIDSWRARAVSAENRIREIERTSAAIWKDRAIFWENQHALLKNKILDLTK